MRGSLRTGIESGVVYAAAYYAVELILTGLMLGWSGIGGVLWEFAPTLGGFAAGYALLGALLGAVLALPVARVAGRLPAWAAGRAPHLVAMALAFAALAWLWNAESILSRGAYLLAAGGALLLVASVSTAVRALRRLGAPRRAGLRRIRAGAVVALIALLAGAAFQLRSRSASPPDAPASASVAARGPNVVLIVVDTLRRDHVSAYGYPRRTTEHIDRIAAEGVLYERAYTTAPWTLPAHASLFTGLHSTTHETHYGSLRLSEQRRTIAELLRDHGYRTAAFSANPWVGPTTGLAQGFQRFVTSGRHFVTDAFFLRLLSHGLRADREDHDVTDPLIDWIGAAHEAGRPFFAFANFMEAHEPYGEVPEPFFSAYLERALPRTVGRRWMRDTPAFLCESCPPPERELAPGISCAEGRLRLDASRLRDSVALYDAGVRFADHQVGRVYRALAEAGVLDDTLLIVTSDHGELLGEHDRMGHGVFLYAPLLDVPLVIRYPQRFPAGLRVATPVSLVDVLPTIAELLGLASDASADARSLVPPGVLEAGPRRILAEDFPYAAATVATLERTLRCELTRVGQRRAALLEGAWKYIWASREAPELYDLASDPDEENDLAAAETERAERMQLQLADWRRALAPERSLAGDAELDPVTKQALEALGYVE